jgi:hypothetical protein
MSETLTPERAVRLLRAKAGELENGAKTLIDGDEIERRA